LLPSIPTEERIRKKSPRRGKGQKGESGGASAHPEVERWGSKKRSLAESKRKAIIMANPNKAQAWVTNDQGKGNDRKIPLGEK